MLFDGYTNGSTTKDSAHIRSKGVIGSTVMFVDDTPCRSKNEIFLANSENKQRFLNMLGRKIEESGNRVLHADDDADLLIVQTAVECAKDRATAVI